MPSAQIDLRRSPAVDVRGDRSPRAWASNVGWRGYDRFLNVGSVRAHSRDTAQAQGRGKCRARRARKDDHLGPKRSSRRNSLLRALTRSPFGLSLSRRLWRRFYGGGREVQSQALLRRDEVGDVETMGISGSDPDGNRSGWPIRRRACLYDAVRLSSARKASDSWPCNEQREQSRAASARATSEAVSSAVQPRTSDDRRR
ncbi:hypothetical protein Mp_3g00780 [Marchantia polymorpha subsp. ruderalis]|uniref:Uncharacterized protein n=2 Tax=Marchantia polymorpha TaxID=3197 RepID=A0AAF6AW02_MARPO|nr:hypothetical protein MARPO_0007s0074 [Marchantia polymorpha]BBN03936.1 hypothetical protein Mp_3g00780 [Marchantia polymorpha subsp. ruderalis]|eukprot:PTQ47624.1 hypothetical protein MARPO_0007s0074 [Marchantia polymorpha]